MMKSKPITLFTSAKLDVRKGNKSQIYKSLGKDFTQLSNSFSSEEIYETNLT